MKFIYIFILFLYSSLSFAENSFFNNSDSPLKFTIKASFDKLKDFTKNLKSEISPKDYEEEGELIVENGSENLGTFSIKIRPRGLTRNFNCKEMPPFKIIFKKDDLKKSIFAGLHHKMKIVTYCKTFAHENIADPNSQSVKNIASEFFTYRYLNQLEHPSYRVKMLKIKYLENGIESPLTWGFAIEHKKDLGKRISAEVIKADKRPCLQRELDEFHYKKCSYMNFKFILGSRQRKLFYKLAKKYEFPVSLDKARHYLRLSILKARIDHGYAGNNWTIFKKNINGKIKFILIPYDFDRINSNISFNFNWYQDIFKNSYIDLSREKASKRFDEIFYTFENTKIDFQKIGKYISESYNIPFKHNYWIYDLENEFKYYLDELKHFKQVYLKQLLQDNNPLMKELEN